MSELPELRRTARDLEPDRVIAGLDAAFTQWRAPRSQWRVRLASELDVYSAEAIELGIREGLAGWTADALRSIRAREIQGHSRPPELTAIWLAGSIPTATFSALALPLLAGSAVYAKPSSSDTKSSVLFAESLREVDPVLGAAVGVGLRDTPLKEADAVVAYGSDATIAELRTRVPVTRIFVAYGHRISVAAVGPEADIEDCARRAALDTALWDGRGCLSPAYLLVDDTPRGRAHEFAEALAAELEALRTELPRGRLLAAEQTALHELRAHFSMGEANRVWLSRGSTDWGVMLGPEGIRPPPGTLRNVGVVPVSGRDGLATWCAGLAPHLSSLAVEGWGEEGALAGIALASGASRLCALGRLQLPHIEWRHDGRGAIEPLLRALDVEFEDGR